MKREIKFKAKRVDNGEWVEGHYYTDQVFMQNTPCVDISIIRDECHQDHEVKEKTVSQFTGLKDKNGAEIYEGDICLEYDYSNGAWINKERQPKKETIVRFITDGSFNKAAFNVAHLEDIEVTGNIHN